MTTRRETTPRDDAQVRIVGHRLQETAGGGSRATENGGAARPAGQRTLTAVRERHGERTSRLRQVILVDRDVDELREVAVALREQFDFHVTISGNEALTLLQSGTIDTIVVGQTLYSSTGLNVLAEAHRRAPHTQRVLLASTSESTDIERDAAPARPFKILDRPCTTQKLLDILDGEDEPPPTPQRTSSARRVVAPVYHGDYEHVVLETPSLPRRGSARRLSEDGVQLAQTLPIIVFTDDGDFYQSVCAALQDHHDVRLATQLEQVVEMTEIGACPILITDRAGTQTELQRISISLRAAEPALVTIASGTPNEGLALRKLLNTPALYGFLPKPLSASLLRLTVEAAKRHYVSIKMPDASLLEPTAVAEPVKPRHTVIARKDYRPLLAFDQTTGSEEGFDFRRWLPFAGLAVLAIAVIAIGVVLWQQNSRTVAQASVMAEAQLELAERAYAARDFIAPDKANALYFYRQALERDPNNALARDGIDRVVERVVEQAEEQLTKDNLEAATQSVNLLRELRPEHKRIAFLEGQILKGNSYRRAQRSAQQSAEMARTEAVKANAANARLLESQFPTESQPPEIISNGTQRAQAVVRWLTLARQRLTQGRLIAPESDNAEHYFRLVERAEPSNPAVDQGLREIGNRLIADAEDALSRSQLDRARRRLTDAARFGPEATVLNTLKNKIDAAADATLRNSYLRLALQRVRENALFEPAQDSAKYYLSQLQRVGNSAADEAQQVTRAIALKLAESANQATAQQQFNVAVRLIDEARRYGLSGAELADVENKLQIARAPAKTAPPPVPLPIAAPKVVKTAAARFPDDARSAGVSGWVDVGFKINAAGDVYDAVAVASSPSGAYTSKFERAAVAAIRQYKFEARQISDTQVQSMLVRVQFKLQ